MRSFEVTAARLPQTRLGDRYRTDSVDRYLVRCVDALQTWESGTAPAMRGDDIVHKEFPNARFVSVGYASDAVDDLLDQIAVQLREYEPERQADEMLSAGEEDHVPAMVRVLQVTGILALIVGGLVVAAKLISG